ncbi:S1C family serine protease [Porcincola intestinalis]|jgi:serine protease Do|uniref:Trypsin-like serine protease n=1 Tax=Porcincola intestinalis TaxID=2606632 RepID=A0A6L5X9I8_9FIRM|nr:trypsin-like peptidase domain-containing protein [Porcincola intestinalis]MCI6237477.1 trypsin-like peptidase domain-containing protein [Lachnospiraceae bacterium]MCI6698616.1 trypsin-like peptidase domain-containing protein [Lachnospiraceae bacterium]MCI6767968.1 trypsin-like peptidase domain-containing protein [Lachnospiraceae bacterium]MCI7094300.1 trypsin-like peptidase domain-containing protein [Lachnospiraceae bacterium]MDD7061122.1 trypsin-like peptidase domain-containing protein [Po
MKKRLFAVLIAAATIGAFAGGTTMLQANDNGAKLQIAGGETEASSEDQTESTGSSDSSSQSATEVAAALPSGNIAKADQPDVTEQQAENSGVSEVASDAMPALVSITNMSVQKVQDWFSGRTYEAQGESAGTGVIMGENDDELLIVTNNHVVADSDELTVSFIDEQSVSAKVKGTDASNDLAVVAVSLSDIPDDTLKKIRVANVGDSDDVKVGEQVVAIGNALNYGQSVTTGIVSALNRDITVTDGSTQVNYEDLIQTDAAINPGNSGGALLNMSGEVIGINSAKAGENGVEGMGYAIPTSKALPIIEKLMNKTTRSKVDEKDAAYIGITGEEVTSDVQQLYGMPAGIYIANVGDNTPASEAGLTRGMIITKFDDTSVSSMSDLTDLLQYYKGGEKVTITVAQQGEGGKYKESDISLKLGLRSDYVSSTQ